MENKVIQRYFKNEEIFKQVVTDFKTLIRIVNNSGGEYSIQLREDYFNIYYKGNSLARVKPFRRGKYQVEIHAQFAKGKVFDDLVKYSYEEPYKGKDEAGKSLPSGVYFYEVRWKQEREQGEVILLK